MRRYCGHTEVWRGDVSEYYGFDRRQAKGVSPRGLYGYPIPPTDFATSRVMPIAECVAEDPAGARDIICADRPELLEHFSRMRRTRPRSTSFFYLLSQTENDLLDISPIDGPAQGPIRTPKFGRAGWHGVAGFVEMGDSAHVDAPWRVGKFDGTERMWRVGTV